MVPDLGETKRLAGGVQGVTANNQKGHKVRLSRSKRLVRLMGSLIDPRTYLHGFRLLNYYKALHVIPRAELNLGKQTQISPTVTFTHGNLITLGDRVHLNARCSLWAGPTRGRIKVGDDTLFGPEVFIITSNYRFNDGAPVNDQAMDEVDVTIGRDVWIGAKAILLPGATIGDGAVIAAGATVRGVIPPFAIATGNPATVIGTRQQHDPAQKTASVVLAAAPNPAVTALLQREIPDCDEDRLTVPVEASGLDSFDLITLRLALETAAGRPISDREWTASGRLADIAHLPCLAGLAMDNFVPPKNQPVPPTATPAMKTDARYATPEHIDRHLSLNMPQMALSGLSEAWLFKELGDMHWELITGFLGQNSSAIVDEADDRLYATFTRFLLEVDPSLRGFSENAPLHIGSDLSRFGSSLYLSDHSFDSPGATGRGRTMSTFAKYGERGKNTSLMKGTPIIPDPDEVPSLSDFPVFSSEYRDRRKQVHDTVLFECEYDLLPPHDINGVGLMYFAAYPTVFDLCLERAEGKGFLTKHSTMLKDISYFANSEPTETLVFRLHERSEAKGVVRHLASLSRKSDGVRMSEAISEKRAL